MIFKFFLSFLFASQATASGLNQKQNNFRDSNKMENDGDIPLIKAPDAPIESRNTISPYSFPPSSSCSTSDVEVEILCKTMNDFFSLYKLWMGPSGYEALDTMLLRSFNVVLINLKETSIQRVPLAKLREMYYVINYFFHFFNAVDISPSSIIKWAIIFDFLYHAIQESYLLHPNLKEELCERLIRVRDLQVEDIKTMLEPKRLVIMRNFNFEPYLEIMEEILSYPAFSLIFEANFIPTDYQCPINFESLFRRIKVIADFHNDTDLEFVAAAITPSARVFSEFPRHKKQWNGIINAVLSKSHKAVFSILNRALKNKREIPFFAAILNLLKKEIKIEYFMTLSEKQLPTVLAKVGSEENLLLGYIVADRYNVVKGSDSFIPAYLIQCFISNQRPVYLPKEEEFIELMKTNHQCQKFFRKTAFVDMDIFELFYKTVASLPIAKFSNNSLLITSKNFSVVKSTIFGSNTFKGILVSNWKKGFEFNIDYFKYLGQFYAYSYINKHKSTSWNEIKEVLDFFLGPEPDISLAISLSERIFNTKVKCCLLPFNFKYFPESHKYALALYYARAAFWEGLLADSKVLIREEHRS